MHTGAVVPQQERLVGLVCTIDESHERPSRSDSIAVIRSRVSGPVSVMVCLPTRPKRSSSVGSSISEALQSRTPRGRKEPLHERIVSRVLGLLGFLFGVQVVQVAVELVEAVHGREELVAVTQMVLPDLGRHIALGFEQLRQRGSSG